MERYYVLDSSSSGLLDAIGVMRVSRKRKSIGLAELGNVLLQEAMGLNAATIHSMFGQNLAPSVVPGDQMRAFRK